MQMQMFWRGWWVHPLNEERNKGEYFNHYLDYRNWPEKFFRWYRMEIKDFDKLLKMIEPDIRKQNLNYRETLSPEEKLTITIT